MDLLSLGKEPINEEHPAGSDVRYEPEFEALQAEIDKMSMPSASGGIDWNVVNKLSTEILAGKAKDLLVVSYLAVAQIHTRKMEGFETGITVLRDVLTQFWDDLFPAKKRMKGRVAAVEWWIEKSESALAGLQVPPQPAEKVEGLREILKKIDDLLQGYLEDAPLLRPLQRFVDNLPIKAEAAPEAAEPAAAQGPAEESSPAPKAAKTPPPAMAATGDISSEGDAEKVTRECFKTLRRVAGFFLAEDLASPNGYRWRRIAGWSMIYALPPHTENRTEIPPPADREGTEQTLNELKEKGNWEALIRTAEERFEGALLWLDLTRFTAEGLEAMGDAYSDAREALCRETAFFVQRIAGLEKLTYADGTPFCDHETHQWLKGIRFGTGDHEAGEVPSVEGPGGDDMAETLEKYQSLAKKRGKLPEAVQALQKEMLGCAAKRDRMLWRIGLVQALMGAKKVGFVKPHLDAILADIDAYRLEEWDPVLAVKGLTTVFRGLSSVGNKGEGGDAPAVLNRIARLDPVEGLRLGKG